MPQGHILLVLNSSVYTVVPRALANFKNAFLWDMNPTQEENEPSQRRPPFDVISQSTVFRPNPHSPVGKERRMDRI